MLLEVEQLDVRYGRNHAVKSLNLSLPENGIVTVLGANGAGKSSLLKAIMGIVPVANGHVRFAGSDITNLSVPQRTREGLVLVPEGRQILTSLTVHENLLMGAYPRKNFDVRETDAIYDRFDNLAQRRDMLASVLSGGEQQMLAVGRALLAKPRLMMLDEPSLGLSPKLVGELFGLLDDLHADGLSLLLIEQNTHMALKLAHYGYVLELGTVSLEGTPEQLQDNKQLQAAYLGG
jgi:branched-chain amino acid transport system ATP-binding protein